MTKLPAAVLLAISLQGCAGIDIGESAGACDDVRTAFDAAQDSVDNLDQEMEPLGVRPEDYLAGVEWDQRAAVVLNRFIARKRIQARIVVNNDECFSETDVAAAQEFLEDPLSAIRNSQ